MMNGKISRKNTMLHPFRRFSRSASILITGAKLPIHANSRSAAREEPPEQQPAEADAHLLSSGLTPFLAVPHDTCNVPNGTAVNGAPPKQRRDSQYFDSPLLAIPLGLIAEGEGKDRMKRGLADCVYAVSAALAPLLWLMRLIGLFPSPFRFARRRQNGCFCRFVKRVAFLLISMAAIWLNLYLLRYNFQILIRFRDKFGLMHATSVSTIVTGIKPLINAVNLVIFALRVRAHLRMLRLMDALDRSFWTTFHCTPRIRRHLLPTLLAVLFACFAVPLAYRVFECHRLNSLQPKTVQEWLVDVSLAIVPLLTVWNMLPLCYYVLCNRLVCFWSRALVHALRKEHTKRRYSLKFYYQQFLRLCDLQESLGDVFNPFVFFSLAWALLILSMTIYFITQPTSRLAEPITDAQMRVELMRRLLNERIWLNLGWSLLQIFVASAHIFVICAVGAATNEQTRHILSAVLAVIPDTNAELDRFQISCFVHKMSTQYLWGMTVWRAFPLERSTFFTLVSVIITYSFLLLKLKDNTGPTPGFGTKLPAPTPLPPAVAPTVASLLLATLSANLTGGSG